MLLTLLVLCSSCKKSGDGFSGFDSPEASTTVAPTIKTFAPIADPVIFLASTEKTFVVSVNQDSGVVTYKYTLDSVEVQSGASAIYTLNASSLTAGTHTLTVTATNSQGSDSHTFNLVKNSAPVVTLSTQTATTINCSSGSYTLNVNAVDADSDAMTYSFLLNGAVNGTFLTGTSGASSASVTFTPNCSFSAVNAVAVRVTDAKGESTDYSVSITVTNPFAASIDSFSPITDPTVVLSTATTPFSIFVSGNSPFTYEWATTPGSTIASCNGLASCPIVGTDFTPGRYTLTATLTDSLPSTATKAFIVVLNQKPQVVATPSNASTINMNCSNLKNFNLTINDANYGDSTQTFSVAWRLNGVTNAALTDTTVLATNPMTSQATFSPNCNVSLLGAQSVSAIVSDGHESVTYVWPLNVNYFSETCNNLTSGQICTAVGRLGISGDIDVSLNPNLVSMQPWQIEKHSTNSYFIADNGRDGIWFYNGSGSSITLWGQTIASNRLKMVAGHGVPGTSAAGSVSDLYLDDPRGMAYNSSTGDFYIADYNNNRILKIDSTGAVTIFAGGGASNTDGATRVSHKCSNPNDLVLDSSENKLFVTCYGNNAAADGAIKFFMTNSDSGSTLVRFAGANAAGTNGYGGVGKSRRSYGLTKHPSKRILFYSELETCRISAVSYGDTDSYYGGTLSLAANNVVLMTPSSDCGSTMNLAYNNASLRIRPYDLAVKMNGANVEAIFFNNYNDHVTGMINLSGSSITYGGQIVGASFVNNITIQGASYARGVPSHSTTYFRNPFGMIMDGNDLIVTDTFNGYVTKMSTAGTNNAFVDLLGSEVLGLYDDETNKSLNNRRLSRPSAMIYRENDDSLLVTDEDNYRVRKLNLTSGTFETIMGSGAVGNANVNPSTSPFTAGSQNIAALHLFDDESILLYTDNNGTAGTNRNCHLRAFNYAGSDQSHFGQTLENNRVRSVAGNYTLGCASWVGGYEGTAAVSVPLRAPHGIMTNSADTEVYISDRTSNCVFKMVGANISSYIGTCGGAGGSGGTNSISTAHLLTTPGVMKRDRHSSNTSGENFFLLNRHRSAASEIKFINKGSTRVSINFVDVDPNEIKTVIGSLSYVSGIASFGDQICYSQGPEVSGSANVHSVECLNRTTGTTTIRIGRPSASTIKGKSPLYDEQEGINASSATLNNPFDIEFDGEGNLWISDTYSQSIRKVKRWFN